MKKLLLGVSLAALSAAGSAFAADMPPSPTYKAPVIAPAPVYSWTGFYVGAHVGGGWGDKDWGQTFSSLGNALDSNVSSASVNGVLAGVQTGFNYQVGQWVFGIEGQWSWTNADGCSGHVRFPAYAGCTNVNWYGTVAGRFGYAWDRTLLYAKGGIAFADEDHFVTFNGAQVTNNPSNTRTGWMLGAGLEYAFWNNWSAKIEYNYMDFGRDNLAVTYFASPPGLVENWNIDQKVHVVKFGVNYRFGWGGGGIVARY